MNCEDDPAYDRMVQRFAVAGQIVDFLWQLKTKLRPEEWMFNECFNTDGLIELVGDDGIDLVTLTFGSQHVAIDNNGAAGYDGIIEMGRTPNPNDERETFNYIVLSNEGEEIAPIAMLRSWGKTDDSSVIIAEGLGRFLIRVNDMQYSLPKEDLYTTTDEVFSYPTIQQVLVDLVGEGIFQA